MGVMDTIICPVSGKEIGQGQGKAAQDGRGNIWIVHESVTTSIRTDSSSGSPTVNGQPPLMGPDAP